MASNRGHGRKEAELPFLRIPSIIEILKREGIEVTVQGSHHIIVDHLCTLENADRNSIAYYVGKDQNSLAHLQESVLICLPGVIPRNPNITRLETDEPQLAFYIVAQYFGPLLEEASIHATVVIHPEAIVHPSANIGAYSILEKCIIGEGAVIHSNVQIYKNTKIGKGVTIEASSCIGATGQMWTWAKDGKKWILPQLGKTIIMDDCFIGSNVTIARGALHDTIIGKGCRISHGSMIGHNCNFGEETFISNGVAISGGVTTGKYCFLGTGSRYRSGVILGNNITAGVGAVVVENFLEDNLIIAGVPAKIIKRAEPGVKLIGVPHNLPFCKETGEGN
jgi:UDP-3-O-[3-hydroxymyristoyl] glucosamine N-acyltransferase